MAESDIALESRCLLAASFGFDYSTIASDLHPSFRFFGSSDPQDAPFTILRYGYGQVTSLNGLPRTADSVWRTSDLTFSFGSDDENNLVEALTLSAFDNGLSDGVANEEFTADGVNDVPTLTIYNSGTAIATGVLLNVSLNITPSGTTTSDSSNPSRFQLTAPLGDDPTIFNELMAATDNTGIVEFTLSAFNYEGGWIGIGDAQIFSSTGTSINLDDPAPPVDDHGEGPASATTWDRTAAINGEFEASLHDNGDGTFSDDSVDYFEVQLQAGRQYTFQARMLNEVEGAAVGIYVTDSADDTVADGDPVPGANYLRSTVTVSASYTGTYYVKPFNQGIPGPYSVTQVSDIAVGVDDHGNGTTSADATTWNRTAEITGNIEVPQDTDWFRVSLVGGYEYEFRTNPGTLLDTVLTMYDAGLNEVAENDDAEDAAGDEYHSQLKYLAPASGTYFLAVSGYGSAETGFEEPFRVGTYGLVQVSQTRVTPSRPVITAASNPLTTTMQRPTITWEASTNAVEYDVYINNAATPGTPIVRVRTSDTSYTPTVDLGIGRLQVWVQAISASNARSAWSEPLHLRVITPVSIGSVDFFASSDRPTFSWTSLPGAATYDLWVNNRLTGQSQVINTSVSGTSFTPASDLNAGVYRYWVRGVSSDGLVAQWSSFAEIYVGPRAVAPVLPTFETQPTFEWTAVNGALSYDLWLQRNSTVVATPTAIAGNTWSPSSALSNGDHHWWVRPNLSGGVKGPWSRLQTFNVGGIPIIHTPTEIGATTTVTWTPVTGAASYNLFVRRDFNGQTVITQTNQASSSVTLDTSLPGTYRIWVQAVSSTATLSGWSRPLTFQRVLASGQDSQQGGSEFLQAEAMPTALLDSLADVALLMPTDSDKGTAPSEPLHPEDDVAQRPGDNSSKVPVGQNGDRSPAELMATAGTTAEQPAGAAEPVLNPEDYVMSDVQNLIAMLDS